jgi:hypothetical protein
MNNVTESIVTILTAIIGVAILSILVSRNAQTSSVISSAASGFSKILGTAEAPVTGNGFSSY